MNKMPCVQEVVGVAVTASRLLLAAHMANRVRQGQSIDGPLTAFMVTDVADGVVLRRFDMDTPIRRTADGVVDQLSNGIVAIELARRYPEARPYIGALALRAAAVGGAHLYHAYRTGEVTKGGARQRIANVAAGFFMATAAEGVPRRTKLAGALAVGTALVTAPRHFRGIGVGGNGPIRYL